MGAWLKETVILSTRIQISARKQFEASVPQTYRFQTLIRHKILTVINTCKVGDASAVLNQRPFSYFSFINSGKRHRPMIQKLLKRKSLKEHLEDQFVIYIKVLFLL